MARRNRWIGWGLVFLIASTPGCFTRTRFDVESPSATPRPPDADSLLYLKAVRLNGSLRTKKGLDPYQPLLAGMIKTTERVRATRDPSIVDGAVEVTVRGEASVKVWYYPMFLPGVSYFPVTMGQYTRILGNKPNTLGYNWDVNVDYLVRDRAGKVIEQGEFKVPGQHGQSQGFLTVLSVFLGATVERIAYPSGKVKEEISETLLKLAGEELGRRLSTGPAAAYAAAERERRGEMDRATYTAMLRQKARFQRQSAATSEGARAELAQAEISGIFDLTRSNVVVFGVGVDDYNSDAFPDLRFAASDCEQLVGWFRGRYELTGDQATCLTNADATAVKINRFIKRTAAQLLGPEDTFVFYFSGHGAPDPTARASDGDGLEKYLLVSNSEPDSLPLTGVNLTRLFDAIERLPARRKIILIDSCFAGEAGKRVVADLESDSISVDTYKNAIAASRAGTVLIAASTENQVSLERDDLQSGLFTHHLVAGLSGQADSGDDDERVDLLELYRHVSSSVSVDTGGRQTPIFRGEMGTNIEF